MSARKPFTAALADEAVRTLPGRRRGDGRGAGEGLRHSERALLRFFLRCARNEAGDVGFMRGTAWISSELGYSRRTIEYGRRRLVQLGYLEVTRRGDGEFASLYRVAVERFGPASEGPPAEYTVHPGEKAVPATVATGNGCDPGPNLLRPSGATVATPTYARAALLEVPREEPPNPPPAPPAGGESSTTKCPQALLRGRRCANCRRCGTTKRQLEAQAAADARVAEAEARKAAQLAARRVFEQQRAAAAAEAAARASGRTRYEEWAMEQHLREVAEAEKPINERETG